MATAAGSSIISRYLITELAILRGWLTQVLRPPSQPGQAAAWLRLSRQALLLTAILGAAIVVLLFELDAREIAWMPPRGSASVWPFRIVTDFGRDNYVLGSLAALLILTAIIAPTLRKGVRARLLDLANRLQFMLFAVLLSVLAGEMIKWAAGRGRPFVGGKANAFNFTPFVATEAHASFPSAHAITAVALAFAVSALWPRARLAMIAYAMLIIASRLVLLAHHPSDVVAGALIGGLGAMLARYWFAARGVCFAIHQDGQIVPRARSAPVPVKGVAGDPSAP
jgi:undecaprenyl-diphosphatase